MLSQLQRVTHAFGLAQGMLRELDGSIIFWSRGLEHLYGYTAEEVLGKISHELLKTDFSEPLSDIIRKLGNDGRWQGELVHYCRNGTKIHVASQWAVYRSNIDEPDIIIEVNHDITALKQAEALLRTIAEAVPGLVYAKDKAGRMLLANAAALSLIGKPWSAVAGRTDLNFLDNKEQATAVMANDERIMTGNTPEQIEEVVDGPSGHRRVWLSVKAPLRDNDGNVAGLAGVSIEVTERRLIDQKLQRVQGELLKVARSTVMGEMASTLAHELNQPLGAIVAYMNGCRRMLDQPDIDRLSLQEGFEGAAEQALRAGHIIRRIREFNSRDDSKRQPENLSDVVLDLIALTSFEAPGITITHNLDQLPILVLIDKTEFYQVVRSLFRNAVESMQNSPFQKLDIATSIINGESAEVRISDRGSGIAENVKSTIFDAFTTTKLHGAGLGLSISRTIIDSYGGKLSAEPNPGGGTITRFSLPIVQKDRHLSSV